MRIPGSAFAVVASFLLIGGAQAQTASRIDISLTNYAFAPSTITLKAGTAYRLHLANGASKSHDFSATEFFAASSVTPEDKAKVEDGSVELGGGKSVDVTVTPNRAGTYALSCTHFMHSVLGMTGKIIVQ